MAFIVPDLKKVKAVLENTLGVPSSVSARVVGYGVKNHPDIITDAIQGDYSRLPDLVTASGLCDTDHAEKKDHGHTNKPATVSDNKTTINNAENKPAKRSKKPVKALKRNHAINNHLNDITTADIVPADNMSGDLPAGLTDDLKEVINDFCTQNNIAPDHIHPQQWRSACMYVGQYVKSRGLLRDREKEKHNGGTIYNPYKLESLLYVWAFLCGVYHMVPLVHDFVSFCGVHRNYFYDYDGQGLSSTAVQIVKKARQVEENGLNTSVAGGGAGAVGGMFLLKTRHNYSETVTVQHTSAAAAVGMVDLPRLSDKNS